MKKSICVIFTGGTIGSSVDGGNVNLNNESRRLLIKMYEEDCGTAIKFDTLSPVNMLSETVQPENLQAIIDCVNSVNTDLYDGIIITHGTDSLCFTANYFSQVFAEFKLPIVLVSALSPLGGKHSNGLANFEGAVNFIENSGLSGVFVSFKNTDEACKIHLASRLIYCDQLSGSFHSAFDEHFAEIDDYGTITYRLTKHNPTFTEVKENARHNLPAGLCTDVVLITARGLLNFDMFDFSRIKPKAVVVELYHSGTVCTIGTSLNFCEFAEKCQGWGVPIILSPIDTKANVYGSMTSLPQSTLKAKDITFEMTLVKVMCALAQNLAPDAYFSTNCFFEKFN
jgi:L-asparaginase